MRLITMIISLVLATPLFAADDFNATEEKIKDAMKGAVRTTADTDRDRNRRPVQTLQFFGFRDDMKVLELLPGGGWYTKILAPVLAEHGELYVSIGTSRIEKSLLGEPGFEKVKVVPFAAENISREEGERRSTISAFEFPASGFDLVLTFRNLHNFTEEGRMNMAKAAFNALKPGGVYGVVDHTRRHMQRDGAENGRRLDPVRVISEHEAAGFEFADYADLHYRADDELRYEVGRRTVSGNTDRFTLKFRKP